MLTVEEIKKACEFAEGFYTRSLVDGNHEIGVKDIFCYSLEHNQTMVKQVIYPLFLQRVIEGVNRAFLHHTELTYIIDIEERYNKIEWFVYHGTLSDGADLLESGKCKNIDLCKEQAIKYILEKL